MNNVLRHTPTEVIVLFIVISIVIYLRMPNRNGYTVLFFLWIGALPIISLIVEYPEQLKLLFGMN